MPDRIVLDGNHDYLRHRGREVTTVIKGDTKCLAVAAASCVAKVTRDALMSEESEHYPPYDFESNVGYPAPAHKSALAGYGPSAIHRRSWIFMDSLCWRGVPPAPGRLFLVAFCARTGERQRGERCDGRSSRGARAGARRTRAVRAPAWATTSGGAPSGLRRLDGAGAGEPHRHRQLLGGRARRGHDDRGRRRPARRRRARRRPARAVRRFVDGGGGGVPRARARWRHRARCRTGRCPARSTAGTGSSTC